MLDKENVLLPLPALTRPERIRVAVICVLGLQLLRPLLLELLLVHKLIMLKAGTIDISPV